MLKSPYRGDALKAIRLAKRQIGSTRSSGIRKPPVRCFAERVRRLANVSRTRFINELSRNRTYIRNLEGFCPDPLDDEPTHSYKAIMC